MERMRQPKQKRPRKSKSRRQQRSKKQFEKGRLLEHLEDRVLLAVDFVPAPLGGLQPNRTDVALGIGAGSTQPTIALNQSDPGVIGIANEAELLRSNNAGTTFDAAGNFQALLGTGPTSQGSSDLVFTRDGELKWASLQTDAAGTQSVGVTFTAPVTAIFGVARVPAAAGAEAARPVVVADTNPASDSPYSGYIYVSFTDESTNRVLLSRSEDNGLTWTTPTQVSDDSETTAGNLPPVTPADVTIGPNGDVYVAYHYQSGSTAASGPDNQSNSDGVSGQVFVRRSIDAGDTFVSKTNAFLPGQADISLNVQTIDGAIERARFSTQGARQPTILADPVREGHIYVIANDDPDNLHGSGDEGDIVFARSTDFGETWDRRTIDVRSSFQVMPQAEVDEFGNLVIAWYDSRNGVLQGDRDFRLDVYATYSVDGGSEFVEPFRITDDNNGIDPVTPNTAIVYPGADRDADGRLEDDGDETYSLGNYFDIESFGGTAYVVWNGNERAIDLPAAHQVFFDVFPIYGTLEVSGLESDDNIVVRSMPDNAEFIEVFVNGRREYAGLRESLVGGIRVDGKGGNDTLVVDYEAGGDPVPPGGIFFEGGVPEGGQDVGDTLNILSEDRTVEFQNEQSELDAGLFLIGNSEAISFANVEETQLGSTDYLRPDLFEVNDTLSGGSVLGSEPAITLRNLTLHDVGEGDSNDDFYRITANSTGMLIVNALFDHEQGDVDLAIYDSQGLLISASESVTDNERIVLPVVSQETYVIGVTGNAGAVNTYALEIENFAAAAPQGVVLDSGSDSGMMNNDAITADTSLRFAIQADVNALLGQGVPLLNADEATAGDQPGAAVFVTIRDSLTGTIESGYANAVGDDLFTFLAPDLPDGELIVSASVHIFDGQRAVDANGTIVANPVVGPSLQSEPISVVIDTEAPETTSPQMLPVSDSGMSREDNVTSVMQPAFAGIAGPNDKVRIFANGFLVGEGVAGSDGRWEVTIEPLTDGIYEMTTQVTDLAGNSGESGQVTRLEVDTHAPNTPFLDLVDASDTGLSDSDEMTGDNTLTFTMTTTDVNPEDHLNRANFKYRLYVRPEGGEETLVYNSVEDGSLNLDGGFTDLNFLTATLDELPDGTHNFKLEVEDRAGNISHDFLLPVKIDTTLPPPVTIDLIGASDTGMSDSDNVTRFDQPTFDGSADIGATVFLYAGGQLVGSTTVGSDLSDDILGNGLGAWEIRVGSLRDGIHSMVAVVESEGGVRESEPLRVEVDLLAPNTPSLDLVPDSDSGHSDYDNITNVTNPAFHFSTQDPNQQFHLNSANYKYRLYVRLESGEEQLVYNSASDADIPADAVDGGLTTLEALTRTVSESLPDGVHNFKLEVEDRAGNISTDTLLDVQIDTLLEGVDDLEMLVASDSGMDDTDLVTNINQVSFEGLSEVGSEVSLFADGKLVGTATVGRDELSPNDALGEWTVTSIPLADGVYTIEARVEDWAGNFQATESLQVEIDTREPNQPFLDLDITSDDGVSGSDNVTSINDLLFNMTTTDPGQADHIIADNYKFRLYVRTADQTESLVYDSSEDDDLALSGGFTSLEALQATVNDLADGVYNFKLEVEDRAGNISHDTLLDVTIGRPTEVVDLEIPTTIQLVPSSDTGMDPTDGVTNTSVPVFNGLGEANGRVQLFVNGELVGTGQVGGDLTDGIEGNGVGLWEVSAGFLDEGLYDVFAVVEDEAGNLNTSETVQIEVDTLEPNTPYLDLLPANDSGISDQDNITSSLQPTFNMATIDPNQDDHANAFNYKYRLFVQLDSGVERLVYDSSTDDTFPEGSSDGTFVSLENLRRQIDLAVPDGVHNFKLEVEDRAGNISHDFLLGVTIDTVLDAPAGVVSIDMLASSDTGMSDRDDVTRNSRPTFSGIAEVGATVDIFTNGQLVGTGTVGSDETDFIPGDGLGAWEVTVSPLDDGIYEVLAHVEDTAGNFLRSESLQIEVDRTQPNTPYLDLLNDTGHAGYDNITGESSLSFNFASEDPDPAGGRISEFNNKFRIYLRQEGGGESLIYNSVIDTGIDPQFLTEGFTSLEQLQATLGPFPDGIHNFKLEVEDRAGNISEDFLLTVQIDSELAGDPNLDLVSVSDSGMSDGDNVTRFSQPTFSGTSEVGATAWLRANGIIVGVAEVQSDESDGTPGDGLGAWSITAQTLSDGIYEFTVGVEDWAGNLETSDSITVEIDSTPPNTPYLDLLNDTGHANYDNITGESSLTFNMTSHDAAPEGGHENPFNYKFRIFVRPEGGEEALVYDSVTDDTIDPANVEGGFVDLRALQTTIGPFVDGIHNFKLEVEDRAGNISQDFLLNVQIDSNLDGNPGIDLINSSDSGMFDTDGVTNINEPAFTGVAEVGSTVRLRANGQLIGVAEIQSDDSDGTPGDGLGEWEITSEPLNDGIHEITAEVEDWAGNIETTGSVTIEIDTLQPNTPYLDLLPGDDSGFANDDNVTNVLTQTFNMATIDPNQDSHLIPFNYKYRVFVRHDSGVELLLYDSSTDGSFEAPAFENGFTSLENLRRDLELALPDGVHNLKLEVEDRAGNISEDFLLNVKVDTVLDTPAGVVSIDMLASSDTGMSDRDNVTSINRPTFSGVAEVGAVVTIFANGQVVGVGSVGSDETDFVPGDGLGTWEVDVDPLDDGVYEVLAHVEDLAGNFLRSESLTVEVDTREPNTPHLDLLNDSGHANYDNITRFDSLQFNMTTEDPSPDGGHINSFNYKFRIFVRPEGGAESLVYNSVIDTGIDLANLIEGFTDLEQLQTTLGPFPDGIHNFKLEVEDRAGNISVDTLLNVEIDTNVDGVPNIDMLASSDSGMLDTDNITNKDQPAFKGITEVGATVRLRANGILIGEAEVHSDESDGIPGNGVGQWEITSEPLDDGIYVITADVEDWAGNVESSGVLPIEVDTRAPNTPFLDLTSASDSGVGARDEVTNDNTLSFNMTTTDEAVDGHLNAHNLKFRLYVRPEGGAETLIYNSVTDGDIPQEAIQDGFVNLDFLQETLDELPDGEHNFKLEVEDRAGNISQDFLLDVTIDTSLVAPTIDLNASSDSGMSDSDNVTGIDEPTFSGTGDVGDRVFLYANGVLVGTGFVGGDETDFIPGDGRGAWEITTDALDDGVYNVLAHLEDEAGNFQRTEPIEIEVDTLEPNTPHLDLITSSDSGHSNHDNITGDTTPSFTVTTEDPNQANHLSEFNYKYRFFLRPEGGEEVLVYNSVVDPLFPPTTVEGGLTNIEFISQTLGGLDGLPDGIHNLKVEVEDRAGNISHDVVLTFEIDSSLPDVGQVNLLTASDTGMSASDNVTNKDQPAFDGLGTPGTQVRLFANGEFVGTAEVGSDESDGIVGNGLGIWEITSEPLDDGVYTFNASFEDWAGNISTSGNLTVEVDTIAPNTPFLDLAEPTDSGRHNDDNITNAASIGLSATTEDPNLFNHLTLFPGGENLKYRIFLRPESGAETIIFDSATNANIEGRVDGFISATQVTTTLNNLPEGLHNFKLEVEDRAGNISHDFLMNVLIDRTPFQGTVGIDPSADTGIWGIESTFGDGITGDAELVFTGTAEANNIVSLFVDGEFAGSTVALPFDGDDAFTLASWELTPTIAIPDGTSTFEVRFEDPAGNQAIVTPDDIDLNLVIDTTGPRIENVTRNDAGFTSLFDPKPAGGPDPLIDSIVIHFVDGPDRPAGTPYGAVLEELALEEGNYRVVGDANGNIPITNVAIVSVDEGPGIARTAVRLDFGVSLPDDRFTLTVSDRIADDAGNPLDGESGANGPFLGNAGLTATSPIFPTGDGNHGADFLSRFTVDSRPELGVWAGGSVYVDTNGNFVSDPTNLDYVNRDISYSFGFTSDDIFAGNFAGPNGIADGYDKLAAYGRFGGWVGGTFRWLVDLDNDGVADIDVEDPADVNGLPVAGNFDGNAANGDEVGLYDGHTWHIDTDGDYLVDLQVPSALKGYPVVGDFDRDGFDDLATFADDRYMVDLAAGSQNGWDGVADAQFRFGFIGARERPVVADMDQDGYDDIGLWVPDRGGATPREAGEWYWLVSGGNSVLDRIVPSTDPVRTETSEIQFTPIPFGNDVFAQFGDEFAMPVVGNFDPPSLPGQSLPSQAPVFTNPVDALDVNDDGHVTARDALILTNFLNHEGAGSVSELAADSHYLDTNNDDFVSARDLLRIVNFLNEDSSAAGEPIEDAIALDVAVAVFGSQDDGDDKDGANS